MTTTRRVAVFGSLALAAGLACAVGDIGSTITPPNTRVQDCTTSGCHSDVTGFEFLHGPVAVNACTVCHTYEDPVQHTFTLPRTGEALCAFCHEERAEPADHFLHQPVEEGRCLECHDPHGSQHRMLLQGATPASTCLTCHASVIEAGAHRHTPVAEGDCLGCHRAHASPFAKLLVDEGRDLCLRCHGDVLAPAPHDGTASPEVFRHAPVDDSCASCHDPHASDHADLLVASPDALCVSCHDDIATHARAAAVPHSAVTDGRSCMNCHAPHQSQHAALLTGPPAEVCSSCHAEPVKRSDGSTVPAVDHLASLADPAVTPHGPLRDGGCRGCHDPHGAPAPSLLTAEYPTRTHQRFGDGSSYALCFSCHDRRLVTDRVTTTATGFRNGDDNLHAVHVDAGERPGRSCRMCHDVHASRSEHLTRMSVRFGSWDLPIAFKATETGGSCAAGCHRERAYDRVEAVGLR